MSTIIGIRWKRKSEDVSFKIEPKHNRHKRHQRTMNGWMDGHRPTSFASQKLRFNFISFALLNVRHFSIWLTSQTQPPIPCIVSSSSSSHPIPSPLSRCNIAKSKRATVGTTHHRIPFYQPNRMRYAINSDRLVEWTTERERPKKSRWSTDGHSVYISI